MSSRMGAGGGGGDIYTQGPCAILAEAGVGGWMEISMPEIDALRRFARDTPQIKCVQDVCYKSLLSGDILVEFDDSSDEGDDDEDVKASAAAAAPAPKPRPNKSQPLHALTPAQEHGRRQRSQMLGQFAVDFLEQEDTIGFACMVAAANTAYPSIRGTDPKRPAILNLDRIARILFRVDVYGTYEWQFTEKVPYGMGATNLPGERVVPGVRVVGSDLPVGHHETIGILRSKVKRLMNSVYRLYTEKLDQTSIADRERARPTLVTNSDAAANAAAALSDPNHMPAGPLALMPDGMATRDDYDHMKRVGQAVQDANCGTDAAAAAAGGSATRKRLRPGEMTEYAIAEGRMLANSHLPEAPADLLPLHNSVFEMTCLQFGMHMGMLSAGDTTGTAKLNTQQASAETGRFFREAQSERKRRMELILSDAYVHMYRDERATRFARRRHARRGKAPTPDEIDHYLDGRGGPVVSIPSNIPFEQIVYLIEKGFMRWPAGVDLLSNLMCVSQQAWHTKPQIAIEDIAGIPSPAPAAAALAAPAAPKPPASAAAQSKAGSKPKKQKTK